MKKISVVLVLTVGVFLFGNAQNTEERTVQDKKAVQLDKSKVVSTTNASELQAVPQTDEKTKLEEKQLNTTQPALQKRSLSSPQTISKSKLDNIKLEGREDKEVNKEDKVNK